jgi:centrosomin
MDESELLSTQMDLIDLSNQGEKEMDHESLLLADTINKSDNQHSMATTSLSSQRGGGFCVKEYEDQFSNLQKENFNLKLRIYYLEKSNPNVPEDAESLVKQNIDLKVQNEALVKDLDEKQNLLMQASKALELLEEAKIDEEAYSKNIIEDLRQQVESLTSENENLQQALSEANNKTNLGNDTGYAEFLGAVDAKYADIQRRYIEMTQCCEDLGRKLKDMNVDLETAKIENENLDEKIRILQNEKMELKKQVDSLQSSSSELVSYLKLS